MDPLSTFPSCPFAQMEALLSPGKGNVLEWGNMKELS